MSWAEPNPICPSPLAAGGLALDHGSLPLRSFGVSPCAHLAAFHLKKKSRNERRRPNTEHRCQGETALLEFETRSHEMSASMGSGECSSDESRATRTSVREPQLEPEMRRQNPAQRRQLSSFVRTTKLVKSSDRPRLLRARAWHCRADRPKARLPPRRSRWNRDRLQL